MASDDFELLPWVGSSGPLVGKSLPSMAMGPKTLTQDCSNQLRKPQTASCIRRAGLQGQGQI